MKCTVLQPRIFDDKGNELKVGAVVDLPDAFAIHLGKSGKIAEVVKEEKEAEGPKEPKATNNPKK